MDGITVLERLRAEPRTRRSRSASELRDRAGHEVLSAEGAAEGIEAALAHAPDLILMDVQMPDMDGIAALRLLRAERRSAALPSLIR